MISYVGIYAVYILPVWQTQKIQALIFVNPSSWQHNDSWFYRIFRVSISTGCLRETCKPFAKKLLKKKLSVWIKAVLPEAKPGAMHSRRRVVHAMRKEKDNEVKVGKQLLFLLKSVFSLSHLRCPGLFGGTCIYTLGRKLYPSAKSLDIWDLFDKDLWKSQNKNSVPFS